MTNYLRLKCYTRVTSETSLILFGTNNYTKECLSPFFLDTRNVLGFFRCANHGGKGFNMPIYRPLKIQNSIKMVLVKEFIDIKNILNSHRMKRLQNDDHDQTFSF